MKRGQASVELALVATTLILLSLGAVQLGVLYGKKVRILHAAREGARWAAVHALDTGSDPLIKQHAIDAEPDLNPAITLDQVSVSPVEGDGSRKGNFPIQVMVTYQCPLTVPIVSNLFPSITLSETVSMRIEG